MNTAGNVIPFAQAWEPAARHRQAAELVRLLSPAARDRIAALAADPRTLAPFGVRGTDEDLEEAFSLDWLAAIGLAICHDRTDGRSVYRLSAVGWAVFNLTAKEPLAI